ncbi:hypothetical protein MRS44_017574 [Fusarium solani]|uniref:uncharacterized protein n=1 Tax=Fusarium solani TaxID=169388 RepID=UPI0032C4AC17|nr:hypothetical protein MRS44_017574 [Fusarium solani]
MGACPSSSGNGQEGNDVNVSEREQKDGTTGVDVDVVAAAEKDHRARGKRLGRSSRYDSLANAASTFRQILPKEPEVEDTEWRQYADAIARSLPRRPLRGDLRSIRARKPHDPANRGGSARHQPSGQLENGRLRGTGVVSGPGTSAWQPSLFREHGAPEAANSESPLLRRHFFPRERGPEDDEQGDTTAVSDASLFRRNAASTLRPIEPKQLASNDTRRSDQAAAAIARGLPKRRRPRRTEFRNCQETPTSMDVDMAAVELGRAAPGGRPLLPKLPGAPAEVPSTSVPLTATLYAVEPAHTETVMCSEKQLKRGYRPSKNLPRPKRARVECRRERREDEQRQDLAMVLCQLEEDFAEKERLSQGSAWCTPIPFERKITTVRDFYDAFHNTDFADMDLQDMLSQIRQGIDVEELESWEAPSHGVPSQVYDRLERNEPSAREKIQRAHIVPPIERGLEVAGPTDIREILASLEDGEKGENGADATDETAAMASLLGEQDAGPDIICEISSSGRGEDFADSFDAFFFAKTFPTLLSWGMGGPRQADENMVATHVKGKPSQHAAEDQGAYGPTWVPGDMVYVEPERPDQPDEAQTRGLPNP